MMIVIGKTYVLFASKNTLIIFCPAKAWICVLKMRLRLEFLYGARSEKPSVGKGMLLTEYANVPVVCLVSV